jgi:transcriptional regulator with XRE-family HTH domain
VTIQVVKMAKDRAYSRYTREAAALLAKQVQLGRKRRKWTERELADRAGISRATLQKIEKGDLSVAIGIESWVLKERGRIPVSWMS